jgi:hypothetical protein
LVVATNLRAVAGTCRGARVLNDLCGSVLQLITAVALRSELKTSHTVTLLGASIRAGLDGVGGVVVSHDGESAGGSGVGPAATVGHVARVGVVVHRGGCRVKGRVGERIIASLKSGVSEVVRAVAVAVEVVCEEAGKASGSGHHSTSIVAHVDKVHGITVVACRVGTRCREGLDEVEEALMTVATSCEGRTGGRVIALVLRTTSVSNLLALVVGDDSLTS